MFFKYYVYFVALILNYINILKICKGSMYSLPFFIFKNSIFVILFNLLLNNILMHFNVLFIDIRIILIIFIVSIFMYFLRRKYVCISFSGTVSYLVCRVLNIHIEFKEIMILISLLHIFEGLLVIFSVNESFNFCNEGEIIVTKKMYLPIILNKFPMIFMIFYRRNFGYNMSRYKGIISGFLIIVYGIIVLLMSFLKNNYISLILIPVLHESIILVEKFIFKYSCNLNKKNTSIL